MRSYVPDFQMEAARDVPHALECMAKGFRPFAGGTDIMVLFNAGKLKPVPLVNIRKLAELRQIATAPDYIEIGAAVTFTQIQEHSDVRAQFPLLTQAAGWTGSIANQNRGSLGGNIANASPAADSAPVLLVHDAELKLISSRGERLVPYSDFHRGYKVMAMEPDELIAAIRLRRPPERSKIYGRKVGARNAMAIAKVSFAATAFEGAFHIAVGSVAPVPMRCVKTEEFLNGERITPAVIAQGKQMILRDIAPISDIRSTASYRLAVTQNLLGDFLESLL